MDGTDPGFPAEPPPFCRTGGKHARPPITIADDSLNRSGPPRFRKARSNGAMAGGPFEKAREPSLENQRVWLLFDALKASTFSNRVPVFSSRQAASRPPPRFWSW